MIKEQSEKLYRQALCSLPGGVDSPVRAFRSVGGTPLFMQKGQGAHVTDEDGNTYVDYCMSWGPLILGHAHPDVVAAISLTAAQGTSFGTPHRYEVDLAAKVIDAFPSIEKVRFVNSGTEATMSAVRLARGYTGRDRIIKFDGCYHGHADYLLVAAGSGLTTFGVPDSAGVTAANANDTIVLPFNDTGALEQCLENQGRNVAALILEPVPCNHGLVPPAPGYLETVRTLCDKHGIVLIFDEVINGFRLSRGGAQELYDVRADLTALGKIIGGGLPVGAYGGRRDIMEKISPDGPVYQAGTLSGNPLAMAAGIATLEKLADGRLYQELRAKAARLRKALEPALEKYRGRFLLSQLESIFTFSFTDLDRITSMEEVKACNMKLFAAFHEQMLNRGVYLAPSGYEVGFLSAAHSDDDIDRTAAAVAESLEVIL